MGTNVSIVWFRNDLRLHDNEALTDALQISDIIVPVYIFDDRFFRSKTKFGFDKTAKFRTKFIIECIEDLQTNLKKYGSDLIVLRGKSEELIMNLAKEYGARWVFCNRERTQEELDIQDALEKNLWTIGREIRCSRGKMLYYTLDLPFPVTHTPDGFTSFRKEVEKFVKIRKPLEKPHGKIKPFEIIQKNQSSIPSLVDFGYEDFIVNKGLNQKGGETSALREIKYYFEEEKLAGNYKEHYKELLGRDFSTKLSAYLSQGCISPKMVYRSLLNYEALNGKNDSTHEIFLKLLRRDYFRLIAKKYGDLIFLHGGLIKTRKLDQKNNFDKFEQWKKGETGVDFIDANMNELNQSGYMSNIGRINVASYLVDVLKVNWLLGAEYFESLLIDYDPSSNYGNWNRVSGVDLDPKERRIRNASLEAKRYDPSNTYIKYWLK